MAQGRHALGGERGSALIISMVLIFIMTLLGLALFDLGALENRMALSSQIDAKAFETAQAGIERGLRELYNDYAGDSVGNESWADGTLPCTGGNCTSAQYRTLNLANTTLPLGGSFAGSYTVEVKLLTGAEAGAAPYGQKCTRVSETDLNSLCKDLAFVRSTGTVDGNTAGGPPGHTATTTIQVLAKASSTASLLNGVTAGTPSGQSINGNVIIAGTINILGDPTAGVPALALGGGAGQRNNWAGLDALSLQRLKPLTLICPPGRTCSGPADYVESLGAQLLVARPITAPAVDLSGGAAMGQPGDSALYGLPPRRGKGPLDGVFVADGCVMPCTDNFAMGGSSGVYADGGITKPYPSDPPPPFPLLTDPITIDGTQYNHFACPNPAGSCNPASSYMGTHAADFTSDLASTTGSLAGLRDNTASFQTPPRSFVNRSGATRWGQICWDTTTDLLTFAVYRMDPGPGSACNVVPGRMSPACPSTVPSCPLDPLLASIDDGFKLERQGGPSPLTYAGAAVIVTTGGAIGTKPVKIEETWQTVRPTPATNPCNALSPGECFPDHHMLAVLSFSDVEIGKDNANIDRVMGFFYTQQSFFSQKQTSIVGGVTAYRLCFAGGCGQPGGNVPRLFQVPADPRVIPEEVVSLGGGRRWSVGHLPRFWLVCRPGSLSPTPTGVCGY